jgi:DNA-3-methyladenine glycosylase II
MVLSLPMYDGFFRYGPVEIDHLTQQDPALGQAIERIGMLERPVIPDPFAALVHSVVAQQISGKAAATVSRRLVERLGAITPATVGAAPLEDIQRCGLSLRKASTIKGLSDAVAEGALDLDALPTLPDDEVIARLSALRGIGVWTAEMILIFSLQRPDVVSWGDLGIRRGMMTLYGRDDLDRAAFDRYRARYSPFGSVASLYLWRVAAGE